MKKNAIILSIIILSACGCGNQSTQHKTLVNIDSMIYKGQYDSAMVLLNQMKDNKKITEGPDSIYFEYLYLQNLRHIEETEKIPIRKIDKLLEYYKAEGDNSKTITLYCLKAYVFYFSGKKEDAFKMAKTSERLLSKGHTLKQEKEVVALLANLNMVEGNDKKAMVYMKKLLYYARIINDHSLACEVYSNIAATFGINDMLDSAYFYMDKCREELPKVPLKDRSGILLNVAMSYIERGDYKEARKWALEDIKIKHTPEAVYTLGITYMLEKKYDKADSLFDEAMAGVDTDTKLYILKDKAEMYRRSGQYEKAAKTSKEFENMNDTLKKYRQAENVLLIQNDYDVENEKEKSASNYLVIIVVGILAVAGASVVAVLQYNAKNNAKRKMEDGNRKIAEYEQELKETVARSDKNRAQAEAGIKARIEQERRKQIDLLSRGRDMYGHLVDGSGISLWSNKQLGEIVEFFRVDKKDVVEKIEEDYKKLSPMQTLCLLLLNEGWTDERIKTAFGQNDGAYRTMMSRIKGKRRNGG